jgi:hypothetical protein
MLNKQVCKQCYIKYKLTSKVSRNGFTIYHVDHNETELGEHFDKRWNYLECRCPHRIGKALAAEDQFLIIYDPPEQCPYILEQTVNPVGIMAKLKAYCRLIIETIRGRNYYIDGYF